MIYDADVAVVGLGSVGSMATWRLAESGSSVHGFEQHALGHDRGAAGGESRRFATHGMGDPREVPLVVESQRLWRALESRTGRDLLNLNGGLIIGPDGAPSLVNAQTSVTTFDLPHEHLSSKALRERYPEHRIDPNHLGLLDPLAGYVRPQVAVVAGVEAARSLGAAIHDHVAVLAIEPDADGVTVVADDGTYRFGAAVVAPGPWFRRLLPQFQTRVQTRRVLQAWFIPRNMGPYHPDRFPVFQRTGDVRVYGFPSIDGATVKLGVTAKVPEIVADPDNLDPSITAEHREGFRDMVAEFLPGLYPDPVRISVYMEGYSTSMQGLVGPVAGLPHVVAVCGLSGTGFKFVPVLGEIASEFAIGARTSYDVDFLLPDRPQDTWPIGVS
ncbi:MAG: putative sarcosine oxidase [Pseudonocardiales bacterium]|nr:putative sarcosine oxidase [Pseudonocardiales bacterium]